MTLEKKWDGARCLFRIEVKAGDGASIVEDRLTLVEALEFDEATACAEAEARACETFRRVNADGQQVGVRYLGACDLYEMGEKPGHGVEVHSTRVFVDPRGLGR